MMKSSTSVLLASRRRLTFGFQALESEGNRCQVVGEYLGSFGVASPGHPVPEVWGLRQDAERATTLGPTAAVETATRGSSHRCSELLASWPNCARDLIATEDK